MSGEAFSKAHAEAAEALGAYALGALPDAEAALVQAHLRECERCQVDLAALSLAVDALPSAAPPVASWRGDSDASAACKLQRRPR